MNFFDGFMVSQTLTVSQGVTTVPPTPVVVTEAAVFAKTRRDIPLTDAQIRALISWLRVKLAQ